MTKRPERVGVLSDAERRKELRGIGLEYSEAAMLALLRRERAVLLAAARRLNRCYDINNNRLRVAVAFLRAWAKGIPR